MVGSPVRRDGVAVARIALPLLLVAVAVVVAGLAPTLPREPTYTRYVAFGDSFTAAPYVPVTDLAAGCLRSDGNYPSQVARTLRVAVFEDRSCTGAQVGDLAGSQRTRLGLTVPPQLAALTPDTDLVTVGLGFNNGRLYGRIASRCRQLTGVCRLADERPLLESIVQQLAADLTGALVDIKERAPQARVLLVGYPRMLPPQGDCLALPRFRPEDRETFRDLNADLNAQMELAARVADVEFVDFYARSFGHDVCAPRPWVEGRNGDDGRAAALHPLPAGQRALAELVTSTLRRPPPGV